MGAPAQDDDLATRSFRKLSVNNALANHRLAQAVITLPRPEFAKARTGFFPSLKATLNHIYAVDWLYIDALLCGEFGPWPHAGYEPYDAPQSLYAAQGLLDIELFAFCQNLGAESLGVSVAIERGERVQVERVDDVLTHLFQHQTHHRGQAHAMLAGTALRPPQLDEFIVADDAGLRRKDLAALGWDESVLECAPSASHGPPFPD